METNILRFEKEEEKRKIKNVWFIYAVYFRYGDIVRDVMKNG